jgi:hypothetical protein
VYSICKYTYIEIIFILVHTVLQLKLFSTPTVVYGLNLPEAYQGNLPSKAATAVYGGFHRLAWAMAVSWVVFACCRGYGGT